LQPAEKRKQVFDAILKVEEYKQANTQMRSLESYTKGEVAILEQAIAQYNEALQTLEPLTQRRHDLANTITHQEATLTQLQTQLVALQTQRETLAVQAQQVQTLESKLHTLTAQINGKRQAIQLLEQSVGQAQQAADRCAANQAGFQAYQLADAALQPLEKQLKRRKTVFTQRDAKQKMLNAHLGELTTITVKLDALSQIELELNHLQPLVQQQVELEQQQQAIAEQLQQLQALRLEQQSMQRQQTTLVKRLAKTTADLEHIQALAASVAKVSEYEQQRDRLQEHLSRLEAATQFERDLQQLVSMGETNRDRHDEQVSQAIALLNTMHQSMPLLATDSMDAAVQALEAGLGLNDTLLDALRLILTDLSAQTDPQHLKQQLQQMRQQLELAYRQQAEFATLETKQAEHAQLQTEQSQTQHRLETIQMQLQAEVELQQAKTHLSQTLEMLGDPRGRTQLLQRELGERDRLQATQATLTRSQAELQQELTTLEQELETFVQIELQIEQYKQQQQAHQPAYLIVLQSQNEADGLPALQLNLKTALQELQQLETQQMTLKTEYEQQRQNYSPEQWQQVETDYAQRRSQADQLTGSLPQQRTRLAELDTQLATLQDLAEKRDRARAMQKEKERVRRFITFARKAYRDAGPRIVERYVQRISHEADRLFRELLNRPNVALEWSRDYEIIVQEGPHSRRFINLSGGEQMCAALAVRLALLRVLADIDIAFFDEPTTNMDRPRRESLAEAIGNIRSFRQLFVISHDDTFEKVTENVILINRDALY
jgi:DNA repair protein SbcC/Rad50